jgi:hypothetical protein
MRLFHGTGGRPLPSDPFDDGITALPNIELTGIMPDELHTIASALLGRLIDYDNCPFGAYPPDEDDPDCLAAMPDEATYALARLETSAQVLAELDESHRELARTLMPLAEIATTHRRRLFARIET